MSINIYTDAFFYKNKTLSQCYLCTAQLNSCLNICCFCRKKAKFSSFSFAVHKCKVCYDLPLKISFFLFVINEVKRKTLIIYNNNNKTYIILTNKNIICGIIIEIKRAEEK